jgi:hypothetical protein
MKYVSSWRRQIVMATLLSLAVVGAIVRYWAPNPSLARDIGTLLLVLWLPAVGNLIAFLVRRWAEHKARRRNFDPAAAFVPHLVVRFSAIDAQPLPAHLLSQGGNRCTVVVGTEGFTARTSVPLLQVIDELGRPHDVSMELLRPELALPRLPPGARFQLLAGQIAVAQGTVERAA